jgi:hypothetical protein
VSDALTALLDRVADAASKATPGPWRGGATSFSTVLIRSERPCGSIGDGFTVAETRTGPAMIDDATHIANCDPDLVSALVAVVRACDFHLRECGSIHEPGMCSICDAYKALVEIAESRARKEQP